MMSSRWDLFLLIIYSPFRSATHQAKKIPNVLTLMLANISSKNQRSHDSSKNGSFAVKHTQRKK